MSESLSTQQVAIIRSVNGLVFDAVFEEAHESELVVTDNPVETGVNVSDHAYMNPLKLIISAGVTDTPLNPQQNDVFASDAGRSKQAYRMLQDLQRRAEPFSVQTGLRLYNNMVCTVIRTAQDKDTAGALFFTAILREVIITYTQVVTYPPRKKGTTARQASARKSKGEQQSTEVTVKSSAIIKARQFIEGLLPK